MSNIERYDVESKVSADREVDIREPSGGRTHFGAGQATFEEIGEPDSVRDVEPHGCLVRWTT